MIRALTLALCLLLASPALALNLSKTPAHYAQELETYYLKPRPEMLPSMLQAFDAANILANAQKRMFVAAFLAALALEKRADIQQLATANLGQPGRQTLAWAAWLSGNTFLASHLLQGFPPWIGEEMRKRPSRLEEWNPAWEKSVLDMQWAAFLATGSNRWLDIIIDSALTHAHGNKGGSRVAASLYELAPRHQAIVQRLRQRLPGLPEQEGLVLRTILDHCEGKN